MYSWYLDYKRRCEIHGIEPMPYTLWLEGHDEDYDQEE